MPHTKSTSSNEQVFPAGYSLVILPAIGLGIFAMTHGGISPALWGQQAACWCVGLLLVRLARRTATHMKPTLCTILFTLFLAATLFGKEADGARRWVDLGIFNVNAAMLVLPAMIAMLYRIRFPAVSLLVTASILFVQPDLSQLSAFSAAAILLLWQRRKNWQTIAGCAVILTGLLIRCRQTPSLQPVSYCEGILSMLGDVSWVLEIAGCLSLAAIPVFFLYLFLRKKQPQLLSLAAYYAVMLAFIVTGDYPVPFIGFGLSPILGFFICLVCSVNDSAS